MASQIRFGACVLDVETRRLLRDGREVHLTPKAFDLLRILAERAPRALTKTELLEQLWPNTFVSDDALARLISDVRLTIGDNARQATLIRTIHGFGYAFTGDVQSDSRLRRRTPCKLTWASHDFPLSDGENVIGRDPDVAVPINASIVSRRHARVAVSGDLAEIEDLGSKNGTFVSGERITAPHRLKDGDIIKIGDYELTFRVVADDLPTITNQG